MCYVMLKDVKWGSHLNRIGSNPLQMGHIHSIMPKRHKLSRDTTSQKAMYPFKIF